MEWGPLQCLERGERKEGCGVCSSPSVSSMSPVPGKWGRGGVPVDTAPLRTSIPRVLARDTSFLERKVRAGWRPSLHLPYDPKALPPEEISCWSPHCPQPQAEAAQEALPPHSGHSRPPPSGRQGPHVLRRPTPLHSIIPGRPAGEGWPGPQQASFVLALPSPSTTVTRAALPGALGSGPIHPMGVEPGLSSQPPASPAGLCPGPLLPSLSGTQGSKSAGLTGDSSNRQSPGAPTEQLLAGLPVTGPDGALPQCPGCHVRAQAPHHPLPPAGAKRWENQYRAGFEAVPTQPNTGQLPNEGPEDASSSL